MVALSRFGAEIRYHVASGTHSWPRPPWTREGQVDAPSMVKHVVALLAFRAQDTLRTLLTPTSTLLGLVLYRIPSLVPYFVRALFPNSLI